MLDWVNIALRTVMCLAFLVLVVRPMMLTLVRREPSQEALEELAESAVESAFKAWRQNDETTAYYHNPQLALLVAQNPDVAQLPPEGTPQAQAEVTPEPGLADAVETADMSAVAPDAEGARPALADAVSASGAHTDETGATLPAEALDEAQADEDLAPEDQLKQMRERMKQEQKKAAKPTIPAELLDNANSYEDKLVLVRMIVSQEHDRVAATIKRMVQVN
jgi:hypothetical protein